MFNGTLPPEIGLVTSLEELSLSGLHHLIGSVPRELQNLATESLTSLLLNDTGLTGVIPDGLCNLQESINHTLEFDCSGFLCGCDCDCITPDDFEIIGANASISESNNDTLL